MPTYDYVCTDCGYEFEAFQKMSDAPLKECPECNGNVKRKIGAGLSPVFKGSGFYITDYKKSNPSPSTETKSGGSDTKSTGSSESSGKKAV